MPVIGQPRLETKRVIYEPGSLEGKVPPHDLDAEAAVLSACMLAQQSALDECTDVLRPFHFYSEAHLRIFEAILDCRAEGAPVDVVTVASKLKDRHRLAQVGGAQYMGEILASAPVVANVRAYAETVVNLWKLRQVILACTQAAARGYGPQASARSLVSELEASLSTLSVDGATRSERINTILHRVYERMVKSYQDSRPPGIATGFGAYDDLTAGAHRKDLTIIGARPGIGKTSFMISMMLNIAGSAPQLLADDGSPWRPQGVGFFSLEMPRDQIGQRSISVDSSVAAHRMRTGRLDEADWGPITWSCKRLSTLPIMVDDTSSLPIGDARTKVRRMKSDFEKIGVALVAVFFDYLQLMRAPDSRTRIEEIGAISRGLKELAKEEDVAAFAGCQLNRALESRSGPDKRPRIADLRESGDIEQDADNVVFIHRPAVHGEKDPEGEEGRTELSLAKQRNGPTGTAIVRYVPSCTRFEPMPGY